MNEAIDKSPGDQDFSEPGEDASDNIQLRARQLAFGTPAGFLAFGFGSGLLTRAPGTMGTLAAIPVAVLLGYLDINGFWFLLLAFLLGIRVCDSVSRQLGVEDYGGIVWDEMVAYWLIVAFVPFNWTWLLAAFVIFRAFDILKPWPISTLEKSLEGGLGIMLDDILAAIYTILILSFINIRILGG
jgi:phosphatidylglycerophosphatase A